MTQEASKRRCINIAIICFKVNFTKDHLNIEPACALIFAYDFGDID
jgi:hypothetical protein